MAGKGTPLTSLSPYDAWVLVRVLSDQPVNGELAAMSDAWRPLAEKLAAMPPAFRQSGLDCFLAGRSDRDAIIKALTDVDPLGPAPIQSTARLTAHLGDLAGYQSTGRFIWPHWIIRGHFNLFSSNPKIGKTYVTLDLARRIWLGEPWPDNQPTTFPAGTKTLWICGDRHQDELLDYATSFGLPPEAVLLNASPDEPYGGWDLDHPDNVDSLRSRVDAERPGLIVIDTVSHTRDASYRRKIK